MTLISLPIIFFLLFSQTLSSDPLSCSPAGSTAGCSVIIGYGACSVCLDGYYLGDAAGCFPNNCGDCSSPGYCSSCNSGYIYNGACYNPCPTTTYTSGSTCASCGSNCDVCSSSTVCTTCSSGYYLYQNACGNTCPVTTYISGSICAACGSFCDVCSSSTVCTTCSSGYKKYQNQCYLNCPTKTYQSSSSACQDCSSNCDTCSDASTCTACSSGYYLYNSVCYNPCPIKTFQSSTSACSNCPNNCDACSDSNTCTACTSGSYLYNGVCYNPCPTMTYQSSSSACADCPSNCDVCSDGSTCTMCSSGFRLYLGQCYNPCPLTTYPDSTTTCQNCPSNCDTCNDSNTCTACSSGYRLYQSQCFNPCPVTTFANGDICSDCPSNCDTCTDENTCTFCSASYYLYQTQCFDPCPVTTYSLGTNCLDCSSYCDICIDGNTCTTCTSGYYFYQSKCYVECPSKAPYLSPSVVPYLCYETCPTATPYNFENQCFQSCPNEAPYLMDNVCSNKSSIASIAEVGNSAASAASTGLIARSVASFSNPSVFMFGSLMKLLEYTRYMNISHSDRLEILFQTISDSSDLIPMPEMSNEMQGAFENHPLPDVFSRYDLPSNFLLNEGDDILGILTILSLFAIFWIMQKGVYYLRNVEKIRSLVKNSRIFFQNYLVGKFYEMLGDVLFAAVFEFQTFSLRDRYSWLSIMACISCLVLGVVLYGINFWIIYAYQKKKRFLKREELEKFAEKYNGIEVLFGGFGDESFLQQAVLIFFVARSLLSSLVIAVFYTMPLFQAAILLILSFFMVVYYMTIRSMKSCMEFLEQLSYEILLFAVNACFFIQAMCDSMQASTETVVDSIGEVVIVLNTISKFLPLVFLAIQLTLMAWKYYKLLKLALRSEKKEKKDRVLPNDSSIVLGPNQTLNQSSFEMFNNQILDQSMQAKARLDLLRRNQRLKQKSITPLRDGNNSNKREVKSKPLANRSFVPAKKTLNPAVVTAIRMKKLAGKSLFPEKKTNLMRIQKREEISEIPKASRTSKRVPKSNLLKDL